MCFVFVCFGIWGTHVHKVREKLNIFLNSTYLRKIQLLFQFNIIYLFAHLFIYFPGKYQCFLWCIQVLSIGWKQMDYILFIDAGFLVNLAEAKSQQLPLQREKNSTWKAGNLFCRWSWIFSLVMGEGSWVTAPTVTLLLPGAETCLVAARCGAQQGAVGPGVRPGEEQTWTCCFAKPAEMQQEKWLLLSSSRPPAWRHGDPL